ncbi:hypothetical protein HN873_005371 [Arachis hypogaea]
MALETPATNGKPKPEAEQNNPSPVTSSTCNGGNPNVGGGLEGWLCVTVVEGSSILATSSSRAPLSPSHLCPPSLP